MNHYLSESRPFSEKKYTWRLLLLIAPVLLLLVASAFLARNDSWQAAVAASHGPSLVSYRPDGLRHGAPTPASVQTLPCMPGWTDLPINTDSDEINDLATVSANDVWAVGDYRAGHTYALAEHWNGTIWSIVSTPDTGQDETYFESVTAIAANDVWAVGFVRGSAFISQTLTEHWNGSAWSIVPSANASANSNYLDSVDAVASNDIWAVGSYESTSTSPYQTLTEHWNGTVWAIYTSADNGSDQDELLSVTAISSNDAWAVGEYQHSGIWLPLAEHWNGSVWTIVSTPNPSISAVFNSIDADASNDVWAVGTAADSTTGSTLIEHWDGTAWSVVASPNGPGYSELYGVAVNSASDVWAAGFRFDTSVATQTLTMHWDGSTWSIVSSPSGTNQTLLNAVAVAPGFVWIAGYDLAEDNGEAQSIIERWDGTAWNIVHNPHPPSFDGNSTFSSIATVATDDIWAVGSYTNGSTKQTLIEHWDGNFWTVRNSPNQGTHDNSLIGVTVLDSDDIWAVGSYDNNSGVAKTLTEHYDGTTWTIVTSPNQGSGNNVLLSASANASAGIVRAVGYYADASGVSKTLTLRWSGSAWSIIDSPNQGTGDNTLYSVYIAATGDVWAVGFYHDMSIGFDQTLIEHYDGSVWSIIPDPNISTDSELYSVTAVATNDVWAVGSYSNGQFQTLIEHWNGGAWSIVSSPNQGAGTNILYGVAAVTSSNVWAVGYYTDGISKALALHWDGTSWTLGSITSPGTTYNTLNAATAAGDTTWAVGNTGSTNEPELPILEVEQNCTPPPTFTPVSGTPTACAIQFTDVPADSTFYPFIRCMACRGIINGYTSGCETGNPCFRPQSNVTRGQFAKIASNAAGFNEPAGAQQFADVAVGSTFFDFVWRLEDRGLVSGYACGGAGEPCDPGSLPYFRPNANITRGQITKIDANAAGYSDAPSGQQFADVAVGSTFYAFVYRLATRQIMSGYACGGVGEPCGSDNLPYFRPSSNATRGQASKIVSNTFLPGCVTP